MLQLGLEDAHHLDGRTGRPGDGDGRGIVGGEHLLDGAVGDRVPLGSAPVAGDDDAPLEADGKDGRAVGHVLDGRAGGAGGAGGQGLGVGTAQDIGERHRVEGRGRDAVEGGEVELHVP